MEPYVDITLRSRGKVVKRHRGHNIWVNTGHQWIRDLLSYSSFSPLTAPETRRIAYIGFGIGGSKQDHGAVYVPPLSVDYPGTTVQSDLNPSLVSLERAVRVVGGQYLRLLAPPTFPAPNILKYSESFSLTELTYGGYTMLPLSEVGLFLAGANIASPSNSPVAYETFEPLSKTTDLTLDLTWLLTL